MTPGDGPAAPTATPPPSRAAARLVALARVGWLAYGALVAVGLLAFLGRDGTGATARYAPSPAGLASGDAARLDAGAVLTASSYDQSEHRHPLFLIDGDPTPSRERSWSSAPGDLAPRLHLAFPAPTDLATVEVLLAPPYPAAVTARCTRDDVALAEAVATPPIRGLVRVPLACVGADAVDVAFTPVNAAHPMVRAHALHALRPRRPEPPR